MNKIGIFFGSSTGNTTVAAEKIAAQLGNADLHDVGEGVSSADFEGYDYLILGTSTWGCGVLQDDWETTLPELQKADLSGKTVALFGLGDSSSYSDTFVSAMGKIYDVLKQKDVSLVGQVDSSDYSYDDSEALVNGKFVGLALDEDNESSKTDERIKGWVESIRESMK